MTKAVVVFLLAPFLALAGARPSSAQAQEPRFGERVFVTAIEIAADVRDARGAVPRDLKPADFRITENGIERTIVAIEYLDAPRSSTPDSTKPAESAAPRAWQIVIFVDALTTGVFTLDLAGRELERHVADLLKLGPITIVYSDVRAETLLSGSRDPRQVGSALKTLRERSAGDRLTRMRAEFLESLDEAQKMMRLSGGGGSSGLIERSIPGNVAEEERLLAMGRNNLLRSLGRIARNDPRMLIYVGDGFDLEPEEFYLRALGVSGAAPAIDPQLLRADAESKTKQANVELGRALAVQGWTTVTVGGSNATMAVVDDASRSRTMSRGPAAGTPFTFVDRGAPLVALAEETGGRRVADARKLGTALGDIGRRVLITYQIDREPDPRPRRLEISARRPGITVRAPKWVSSTTPEGTAEARALDLMEGSDLAADLAVDATLLPPAGDAALPILQVSIDLRPLKGIAARQTATKIRISTAIEIPGDAPAVIHQIADVDDFAGVSTFVWRAPIKLPDSVGAIAIVAEELTSGSWGGARVSRGEETAETKDAFPSIAPAPASSIQPALPAASREEAIARAAAERKLVFAFEWSAECDGCSQIAETAVRNTEVAARLRAFVVLPSAASSWTGDPRVAVYDPAGDLFVAWPALHGPRAGGRHYLSAGDLTALLQRAAAAAPHVLSAHDRRAAGDEFGRALALALAYRESDELALAETTYDTATRLARAAADADKEQTAIALRAVTTARRGRAAGAVEALQAIIAAPATRLNEAEARLVLAMIHRASGDESKAAAEIETVLRLAPQESEAYRAALQISRGEPGAVSLADPNGPSGRRLQLVVGGRPPFSGATRLQVIVRDPEISSVEFRVDQEPPVTDAAPPFEARVNLGNVPRRREIRATARDAKRNVVAEDAMILNERHDEFWIRLRSDEGSRLVRAETNLPAGAKTRSLAFFVDGKPVSPLASDANAIQLPGGEPVLVRAVASLEDGRTAEDAALLGAAGYAETIEARDVEIYAAALEASGSPLGGLDRSQFTVREKGRKMRIGGFEFLGRAPFSVGIAVDSSSSMRDVMPDVHRTARDFLDLVTRDGSSAFIVDFDTTPRLAATRTSNFALLQNAVSLIRADGSTALYDALIFGLLQLQGVPGKRALIVLTDGRDETSRYGRRDAVRVARESGVAIYAIILAERRGLDMSVPAVSGRIYSMRASSAGADPELEKIAAESGGRAWYFPESANLETIYRAIDLELRNQYRLTYRTAPGRGASDWRDVKVTVDVPGATARTAAGFIAQ